MKRALYGLLAALIALPLCVRVGLAQEDPPTPEERYEALEEEAQEIYDAWREAIREAQKAAEEAEEGAAVPAIPMRPDFSALVPKFQAAARDYAGTDDAIPFLVWLAGNAGKDVNAAALRTLLGDHAASEKLADVAWMMRDVIERFGAEEGTALLKKVEADSPVAAVRAWAAFARLADTLEKNEVGSEAYETAKRELDKVMEGVEDDYLLSEVGQVTVVREKFSLGMVAPDISGVDLDGTAFHLSDYKGQVVFVDFWGDW
ncbi:MAG: hypothetical protein H6828_07125 [Planctomycetes bacterium]|nr:hypothetical protein [Planctomycetota bacterium]